MNAGRYYCRHPICIRSVFLWCSMSLFCRQRERECRRVYVKTFINFTRKHVCNCLTTQGHSSPERIVSISISVDQASLVFVMPTAGIGPSTIGLPIIPGLCRPSLSCARAGPDWTRFAGTASCFSYAVRTEHGLGWTYFACFMCMLHALDLPDSGAWYDETTGWSFHPTLFDLAASPLFSFSFSQLLG